jgi:hypothetical protein
MWRLIKLVKIITKPAMRGKQSVSKLRRGGVRDITQELPDTVLQPLKNGMG